MIGSWSRFETKDESLENVQQHQRCSMVIVLPHAPDDMSSPALDQALHIYRRQELEHH